MAGNNTNIVHISAIQGLLSEVAKHLKELVPTKETANKFSEQTIAKEEAIEGLRQYQESDVHKLQQIFE